MSESSELRAFCPYRSVTWGYGVTSAGPSGIFTLGSDVHMYVEGQHSTHQHHILDSHYFNDNFMFTVNIESARSTGCLIFNYGVKYGSSKQ